MTLSPVQRVLTSIAGMTGACALAVPAVLALSHNPSFGQRIPVHVPSAAHVVSFDDHGGVLEITHRHRHHHRAGHPGARSSDEPTIGLTSSGREPEPGADHHGRDDHRQGGRDDGGHGTDGGHDDGGHGGRDDHH